MERAVALERETVEGMNLALPLLSRVLFCESKTFYNCLRGTSTSTFSLSMVTFVQQMSAEHQSCAESYASRQEHKDESEIIYSLRNSPVQ